MDMAICSQLRKGASSVDLARVLTNFALQITCLDEVAQQVEVTNVSPIPADIRCSIRNKKGFFVIQNPEFTLEGGKSTEIRVTAAFAEAISCTDQLLISVIDGQDISISLKGQVRHLAVCTQVLSLGSPGDRFYLG